MNFRRIKTLAIQDYYMTKREPTIWCDLLVFGGGQVLVFGYIAKYLTGGDSNRAAFILIGMVLWEAIRICQYTATLTSMWNLWSHSLSNLFIAPISLTEYAAGQILTSTFKTIVFIIPLCVLSKIVFDFNVLSVGVALFAFAILNLILFACSLGVVLLGVIFRFGLRIQAVAWNAIWVFQPLVGVYFPIDVLPRPIQFVALLIPATYAFSGIHNALDGTGATFRLEFIAFAMNLAAFAIGMRTFSFLFNKARTSGQFARNDV